MPLTNEEVGKLIEAKITKGDVESTDILAYVALQTLPMLREIVVYLKAINDAIAPDFKDDTVGKLWTVSEVLKTINRTLEKIGAKR